MGSKDLCLLMLWSVIEKELSAESRSQGTLLIPRGFVVCLFVCFLLFCDGVALCERFARVVSRSVLPHVVMFCVWCGSSIISRCFVLLSCFSLGKASQCICLSFYIVCGVGSVVPSEKP